jgi:uncharacterized protein (DUF433 family)
MRNPRHTTPAMRAPREQPAYTLAEAARYLKLPVATLRSWVAGRGYATATGIERFHPLIHPPQRTPPVLSFANLIEAHVLRSLRTDHGVSVKALRQALRYAEHALGIERLLLRQELRTEGGDLFLERYGQLISLSASGQLVMRKVFDEHLARVVWDTQQLPLRLYPFVSIERLTPERPIVIDPAIAFGRPVVRRKAVSTRVIVERIDAGETVNDLAADYALTPAEIEEAVFYERAA